MKIVPALALCLALKDGSERKETRFTACWTFVSNNQRGTGRVAKFKNQARAALGK